MTAMWAIIIVLIAQIIGALGAIYFKKASGTFKISEAHKNVDMVIGIFCYGLSTVMFIPALKAGELSVLYPLVSTVYIWVAIFSKFMLNEKMTLMKYWGIGTIIAGVVLIGLGS